MADLTLPSADKTVGGADHTPDHNLIVQAIMDVNLIHVGPDEPPGDELVFFDTSEEGVSGTGGSESLTPFLLMGA